MPFNVYCFRAFNLCSCHHPVSECQARVAPAVRKCSGATFLLLLRSSINNLAICTVNPSKDIKIPTVQLLCRIGKQLILFLLLFHVISSDS